MKRMTNKMLRRATNGGGIIQCAPRPSIHLEAYETSDTRVRACSEVEDPDALPLNHLPSWSLREGKLQVGYSATEGPQTIDICPDCCGVIRKALAI